MPTYAITTAVIKKGDRFLIAKRALAKRFAPGQWEFIAGFMDTQGSAEEIILKEIREELSADGKIIRSAPAFEFEDEEGRWVTIPFLIELVSNPKLDPAEHSELKWVELDELSTYDQLLPFIADPGFKSLLK